MAQNDTTQRPEGVQRVALGGEQLLGVGKERLGS